MKIFYCGVNTFRKILLMIVVVVVYNSSIGSKENTMNNRYKQVIKMQRMIVGVCSHEVTVRCINGQYHVRVLLDGVVNQEAICNKQDIGFTARSLLRWEDKCGNISAFASSARNRHNCKDF